MNRILYLVAMYCGARAAFNRSRSFFLPPPRAAILHGTTLKLDEASLAKIRVHARSPSKSLGPGKKAGMISVYLAQPGIPRIVYRLLRLTSHFGCGHIELAFYEDDGTVNFFAVRNILRSNIDRLGCHKMFGNLKLGSDDDEIIVIQRIMQALRARGIQAVFASPDECVALAVNGSLLHSKKRQRSMVALKRRYKLIARKIAA